MFMLFLVICMRLALFHHRVGLFDSISLPYFFIFFFFFRFYSPFSVGIYMVAAPMQITNDDDSGYYYSVKPCPG